MKFRIFLGSGHTLFTFYQYDIYIPNRYKEVKTFPLVKPKLATSAFSSIPL